MANIVIPGTPYTYDKACLSGLEAASARVQALRVRGELSMESLCHIRNYFRIKNIYHSNAIEGSTLSYKETRLVVEEGMTVSGTPLRHTAEARNLAHALDFIETLIAGTSRPVLENDVRQLNKFVLDGILDAGGRYRREKVVILGSDFVPPSPERVPVDIMEFAQWLKKASMPRAGKAPPTHGLIIASVAHTWFVNIHPFLDGNGRTARLLMNLMLARYGYPIAIITIEDRQRYYNALQHGQHARKGGLTPVIALITACIERTLTEYEQAIRKQPDRERGR